MCLKTRTQDASLDFRFLCFVKKKTDNTGNQEHRMTGNCETTTRIFTLDFRVLFFVFENICANTGKQESRMTGNCENILGYILWISEFYFCVQKKNVTTREIKKTG